MSESVYRRATVTWDENSYLFQAHNFADGRRARRPPPLPMVFERGMVIMDARAGWMSRYPPGHPAWLTPGVWLGAPRAMVAVAAALGVFALALLGRALKLPELLLPSLALLSPFFLGMYGTLLSHTSGFTATALLLWAYVRWQHARGWGHALCAGLCWAWLFTNRTYTATLLALPLGLDCLWHIRRSTWKRDAAQCMAFAAVAALGFGVYAAYNHAATGDSLRPTYEYYEPTEYLGFGPRMRGTTVHTLERGLQHLQRNTLLLDRWLWGAPGSLALAVALAAIGWRKRWTPLLVVAPAGVMAGYVAFWFEGVTQAGPLYYFEGLPFLLAAAGLGLERLRHKLPPRIVRGATLALPLLLALSSARFLLAHAEDLRPVQDVKRRVLDTIAQAPPRSLVILENLPEDVMQECGGNPRGLRSEPLVAWSLDAYGNRMNRILARTFPDRTCLLLRGPAIDRLAPVPVDEPLHIVLDSQRFHRTTGGNRIPEGELEAVRFAEPGHAPGYLCFARYLVLPRGRYEAIFVLDGLDVAPDAPLRLDVSAERGHSIRAERLIHGVGTPSPVTLPFTLENPLNEIEPRVHYRGGSVLVRDVILREISPTP